MANYPRQMDSNQPKSSPFKTKTDPTNVHLLYKGTPTVTAVHPFNSVSDIKTLKEALSGWCSCLGPNVEGVIRVLCHRNNEQLQVSILPFQDNIL